VPTNAPLSRDLILGAAVGYRWPQMAPFVRSLRASGCTAEVVLLVGRTDPEIRRNFARYSIRALPVHPIASRLPPSLARKRYNRHWLGWCHRGLPRLIGTSPRAESPRNAFLALAASWFHHPACSRYFAYYRFLRRRIGRHDLVLTSDVRDVVFQADPFAAAWRPSSGQVFLEHEVRHGGEPGNDRWVETGFGAEGLSSLHGHRITCSGLTLAPARTMLDYLAAMSREIALRTDRFTGHDGMDQGVHNWLFWTGRLPGFSSVENFAGPVLTMHGMPAETIPLDASGRVVDSAGRLVPVLHQYDRHPTIASHLLPTLGLS